jgi:hypothetical protein
MSGDGGSYKQGRPLGRRAPPSSTSARQGSWVDVRLGVIEHHGGRLRTRS